MQYFKYILISIASVQILKGMMYLPIPTQPPVEENFEINIVPPPKPNAGSSSEESPITITKELPNNLPDVMEKLDPDDTVIFTETTVWKHKSTMVP